ncbi:MULTISPECIES: PspA/IM30 family protein [Salimicrobium]|uniref:Phage shock protein A (PspA) family protein n=2 Tax=Salimicrobium TaxID=351195 RepID=A0ABY1KMB3_9BACI|nr:MULTISPECIES: PspA/IM30 family protein [Salimicrobium]SDX59016.1 phage shock protein A (PspA) family protein [Salimicrobium album]SIS49400.1 phage shock protein A (PspA) family protein [Salimicrobium salexigens]
MFKFFNRVKTVVGSELNSMLDKAEDPVKMLDQFMRDMDNDIREAESAVAKQIANEKMLKRKYDDAQAMVDKRMKQAEKALESEDEDLARRAIEDKNSHQEQADQLKESYDRAKKDSEQLRTKLDEMKKEYQEMKLKKDSLQARAESAKTRTKMNRTMSDIGNDESKQGFERMEEKVMQHEAEAETSEDLRSESRSLDDEFEELGKDDKVDDELAAMKKKMNKE